MVIASLSPKYWENPFPPDWLGVVGSSATATPFPPVAESVSTFPFTLAEPDAPSAVLRLEMKLAAVKLVAAPPFTLKVPAEKSIATDVWTTPAELRMATVVLPVNPAIADGTSIPVSLPVNDAGAGVAECALEAAFRAVAAPAVNCASSCDRFGRSVFRLVKRPWSSPLVSLPPKGCCAPPAGLNSSCPVPLDWSYVNVAGTRPIPVKGVPSEARIVIEPVALESGVTRMSINFDS